MRPRMALSVIATIPMVIAPALLLTACERSLFDPETLYASADPGRPWSTPNSLAAAPGTGTPTGADPPWLARRSGAETIASPTAIAADSGLESRVRAAAAAPADAAPATPAPAEAEDSVASLAELIDYALDHNPATRGDWERARAAEAEVGMAESRYFPQLRAIGAGGWRQEATASTSGRETIEGPILSGALELHWVLLDFGRRDAASAAAAQALVAANWDFNRTVQTVVYRVERSYFDLDAKLALEETARQNLETAVTQNEAVDERLRAGLATLPDLLLSRQRVTKARFDLEARRSDSINARAQLARDVGLSAESWISIEPLRHRPIPEGFDAGVDRLVEESAATRPDVRARLARVREASARVREAEAAFAPVVSANGLVGGGLTDYRVTTQPGPPFPPLDRRYDASLPEYFVGFRFSWLLFDGWERDFALRMAQSERRAAVADLASLRLDVSNEVWRAYFDLRAARAQLEYGEALLRASEEAYDSVFQTYVQGLRTITDLLEAESDLFTARSTLVRTRAELLDASVRLGYALGAP